MRDPYMVLGISRSAEPKEIKSAFRKLAKKYHPDHNQGNSSAKELFSEINQAYEIIGDKTRRVLFDRGKIDAEGNPIFRGAQSQQKSNPFPGFSFDKEQTSFCSDNAFYFSSGERFFPNLFGVEKNVDTKTQGADITTTLFVTLEQVMSTKKIEVSFPGGKRLKIKLPNFVEDGQVIRLQGQGKNGIFSTGDGLITLRFCPHPRFRLEGRVLHLDLFVSLKEAVLGTKKQVEVLDGRISVTIPPWSGSDRILRLKNKGLPLKEGKRDALYIHVRVLLPEIIDRELTVFVSKYE